MKKTKDEQMSLAGTEEGEILTKLNERVERAIATITELRRERDALKKRAEEAEAKLRDASDAGEKLTSLEEEHAKFSRERSEIRNRIEAILGSLESLDAAEE